MPRRVDVSQIDTMVDQFAAVTVGRQAGRAGVMGAISTTVLLPLASPAMMRGATDTPPSDSFSISFTFALGVISFLVSAVGYRMVYVGSPKLLRLGSS